jgi:hypothetical protein
MVNVVRMANLTDTEEGGAAEERYAEGKTKERCQGSHAAAEIFKKETAVIEYCRNSKGFNSASDSGRHNLTLTHGHILFWWFVLRRCKYE